jgi:hypothetical protein
MNSEPALVPGIHLCDYVLRDMHTNRISYIGCFWQLQFPSFPARRSEWNACVSVTNLRGEIRKLNVTTRVEVPETGHVLFSSSAIIEFSPNNPPMDPRAVIDVTVPMHGTVFPGPATYHIVVLVNSEEIARRPLEVEVLRPAPPPAT